MFFYIVFVLINQSMTPESILSYSVLVLICQSTSQPFSVICSLLVLINQSISAILQCIRNDQSNNQLFDAIFYNVIVVTDQSIDQSKMPMNLFIDQSKMPTSQLIIQRFFWTALMLIDRPIARRFVHSSKLQ